MSPSDTVATNKIIKPPLIIDPDMHEYHFVFPHPLWIELMDEFLVSRTYLVPTFVAICALFFGLSFLRRRNLPPGPRRLPIIGNVHQIPVQSPWITFGEWSKTYGDFIYLDLMGQPALLVNSRRVANDLMDKRSSTYSDRPFMEMANLCGLYKQFVLLPYGEDWRKQRRLMAHEFSEQSVPKYFPLQEKQMRMLVRNILNDPTELNSQIQLRIGAVMLRLTYGYHVEKEDDPFLTGAIAALRIFGKVTTPGAFLVDLIPALKYLPHWMPGTTFLKTAGSWYQQQWHAGWDPYMWCKENLNTPRVLMPNLCGKYIEDHDVLTEADQDRLVWSSLTTFEGGLDSSISVALTFFMCIILNPFVQKKAQEELDSVIGTSRLPKIQDYSQLPYLRAVLTEVYRFCPPTPLGLPHVLSEDDVYEGYFLPKGTWIMPNMWQMLHDPEVYPEPMEFNPERYNGDDAEMGKVNDLVFGFGPRFCPGKYFSNGTTFAMIATTLATCDILPGLDENGNEALPKVVYTPGTITFPEPFKLRLRVRSAEAAGLLSDISEEVE